VAFSLLECPHRRVGRKEVRLKGRERCSLRFSSGSGDDVDQEATASQPQSLLHQDNDNDNDLTKRKRKKKEIEITKMFDHDQAIRQQRP